MKRYTEKTQAKNDANEQVRTRLRSEIACCDWCEKPGFALHEIVRNHLRPHVAGLPALILALCDPGCHQEVGAWKPAKQLALLRIQRPHYFDLATFNRWSTARVTEEDVDGYVDGLISELARD